MRFRPRPALILALLIWLGSTFFFFGIFIPGLRPGLASHNLAGAYRFCNDFYPIWVAGGELLHHRDPFAPNLTPRIEAGLYGRALDRHTPADAQINYRAFSYPVFTVFLFAPLMVMPFPAVQIVLGILLPCSIVLTALLWIRILGTDLTPQGTVVAALLALATYPALEGVFAGQPSLICAAIVAGALAALAGERYLLAGIVLPWAAIKPQLILPLGLWLIVWGLSDWDRRRRFLFGLVAMGIFILAISKWAAPQWIDGWMRAVREYRQISPPSLAQFLLGRSAGLIVSLALAALSLVICWRARHESATSAGFTLATTLMLATTVLTLPSSIAVYDQFLLLPGALWLYTQRSIILRGSLVFRLLTLITMAAVSWQWFWSIGRDLLYRFAPLTRASAAVLLPFRTESSVPFAITALLCSVAFQEIRKRRIPPTGAHRL
jgi:hypothetical protein